jgi:hypothetical protein
MKGRGTNGLEESKEELKEESDLVSSQEESESASSQPDGNDEENAYMMCEKCTKYFNLSNKKPVSLLCCHNILCQACYTRSFSG